MVALSANGRRIVSGSADRTVKAWDLESGQARLLFGDDAPILFLFSPTTVAAWPAVLIKARCGFSGGCDNIPCATGFIVSLHASG